MGRNQLIKSALILIQPANGRQMWKIEIQRNHSGWNMDVRHPPDALHQSKGEQEKNNNNDQTRVITLIVDSVGFNCRSGRKDETYWSKCLSILLCFTLPVQPISGGSSAVTSSGRPLTSHRLHHPPLFRPIFQSQFTLNPTSSQINPTSSRPQVDLK